ncbi:hypothetical protein AAFF_G00098670 [Aldrovandia affinis]|uniref:Uncharacterized protein n=1 Tax=Aldrovandia affinis TaxID=143900 RepID=A0AAD7RV93_9TELE|nr:hypothetical protein AAFF_G00098670 [Aldrovandia affinis]
MLNHKGEYRNGKHSCCGESKKHSVCRSRETGHYHLYEQFPRQKLEMAVHLVERSPQMVRYTKVAGQACKKVPL